MSINQQLDRLEAVLKVNDTMFNKIRDDRELLLATLGQFVRYCEQWRMANGEFPDGDGRWLIEKNARAAIAKAEREEA